MHDQNILVYDLGPTILYEDPLKIKKVWEVFNGIDQFKSRILNDELTKAYQDIRDDIEISVLDLNFQDFQNQN